MTANNTLVRDVPAGSIITAEMVAPPKDSRLWALRRELEETFALR
jgi:predicted homoserine dehydrogenase-like protein